MSKLLFIYNAKSGMLNMLFDVGHKLFSPSTYSCNLCALTFDTFSENKIWKQFREKSNIKMMFFHIDEFEKEYPNLQFEYPVILKQTNSDLNIFINKEELDKTENIEYLIQILEDKFTDLTD